MNNFRTLKWCFLHDANCEQYYIYTPDGCRVVWIHLTGNKELFGITLSNGEHDILRGNTNMQIEKIK